MFKSSRGASDTTRVKICGITNEADARGAIDCGADALGFNLFPGSKRYLDLASAGDWIAALPLQVEKVAVMVNPTWSEAVRLVGLGFIDSLQLHGAEQPSFCRKLADRGIRFTKALRVSDENSLLQIDHFFTSTILLDSFAAGGFGGSGRRFPWSWARDFIKEHPDLQVVLAGGLTPGNVAEAVKEVGPFAVDVTTGVESAPGRKDLELVRAFISAARGG